MNKEIYCRVAFWMCVVYIAVVALIPGYILFSSGLSPLSKLWNMSSPFRMPFRAFLIRFFGAATLVGLIYAVAASLVLTLYFYRARWGDTTDSLLYHVAVYSPVLVWWSAPCVGSLLIYSLGRVSYEKSAGEVVYYSMASVPPAGLLVGGLFLIMLPLWLRIGAVFTE